jgi:hypothetical protein
MFGLILLFCPHVASALDLAKLLNGNWTAETTTISTFPIPAGFHVRINKTSAEVYETNETQEALATYFLNASNITAVSFGSFDSEDRITARFTQDLGHFQSASGRFVDYVFHVTIGGPTKLQLSLVDPAGALATITLDKDIDRTEPGWFKKYGPMVMLAVIFLGGQGVSFLIQRKRQTPNTTTPSPPKQDQAAGGGSAEAEGGGSAEEEGNGQQGRRAEEPASPGPE